MNKLIYLFLVLLFPACSKTNFTLDMIVADGYDYDGKQAYLLGYYDSNSVMWLDSVSIIGNHAKFRARLPYKEMLCEVVVADCPTSFQQFRFLQGENASFVFDPSIGTLYPPVEGSPASEAAVTFWTDISSCFKKQRELRKELMTTDISEDRREQIKRQIESVSDDIRARSFELLSETRSLFNAYLAYVVLEDRLPKDSLGVIKQQLLQRWPDDVNRSMLTGVSVITGDSIGDKTLQTKNVLNRRAVLMGDLPPYSLESHAETNARKPGTEQRYSLNDVVTDFSLPDRTGDAVALSSLTAPYVLIDFWASWCAPCLAEIPYLKKASEESNGELTIFSISIDQNLYQWKDAITQHEMQAFSHGILRRDHPQFDELMQLFDIRTIPANFLLDKDRRIIATNLRGEELQKILKQFISDK